LQHVFQFATRYTRALSGELAVEEFQRNLEQYNQDVKQKRRLGFGVKIKPFRKAKTEADPAQVIVSIFWCLLGIWLLPIIVAGKDSDFFQNRWSGIVFWTAFWFLGTPLFGLAIYRLVKSYRNFSPMRNDRDDFRYHSEGFDGGE